MVAFAAVFGLCVNAQTWTASEVGEGTFYLYNVGAEGYLVGANNWGTRASMAKTGGISITLANLGDGNYSVSCAPTYQNMYLGANGYIDRPVGESSWSFVPVSGQTNVYKMVCAGGTFFADEGATTTTVGADPDNAFAYWKLVSQENRLADMATATVDNPKDATFLILNPNFSRNANNTAWSIVSTGSTNLAGGINENMCAECYMGTFTLSQELTVPNGLYRISGQGAVTYHDNRVVKDYDGGAKPEIYIGDAAVGFQQMTEADQLSNMNQLATTFLEGNYTLPYSDIVSVASGKVTIGARSERSDIWAIWDNFQLQYLGELQDLTPLVEAYEKALTEAKELSNTTETVSKSVLASLRGVMIMNGESRVDKNSKEQLENATKALNDAIAALKQSIASYKVIAAGVVPDNSLEGWVATNQEGLAVNTWSTEADNTGMVTPFIQSWVNSGTGNLSDGMIYYTLEGLNPGEVYYAQALVRAFSEAGHEIAGITFFVNDAETDMVATGNAYTYNDKPGVYGTFGSIATVGSDGKLTIGVKLAGSTFNWVAIKSVTIQTMDAALQASVDKVEAFYGKVPAAVEDATKSFVETTKASVADDATFQTAVNSLNAKAEELAPIATAFARATAGGYQSKYYNDVKALSEAAPYKELTAGANAKLAAAVKDFKLPAVDMEAVNKMTTADEINSYCDGIATEAAKVDEALRQAGAEYNNNAEPLEDAKFNLTFLLTNPNLEGFPTWQKADGWYTDSSQPGANSQVMVNGNVTSEDGTKTAFYEFWSGTPESGNVFTVYQKVTLPKGLYNMSCYAMANLDGQPDGVHGVKFYANDTEGSTIMSTKLAPASIEFVNTDEGEVKIGLKGTEGNAYRWMGIGYLELYRLSDNKTLALTENDTEAPAAGAYTEVTVDRKMLKGLNTLVLPFATTKQEIGAAKVLQYTGSELLEGKIRLNFTEVEALSPNVPYAVFMDADANLPVFENKTIVEANDLTVAGAQFDFVGSYVAYATGSSPVENGDYIASVDGFDKAKGGNEHKAYRAYMKKVAEVEPIDEAPLLVINGAVVNGINAVGYINSMATEGIYNLNGQRVSGTQKGIYIINGKKVVVK